MTPPTPPTPTAGKSLIVTGDDFGLNSQVNEAVERYHQAGLLTQASLMVHEAGVDEAIRIAGRNPGLTVGLHLTLCCGKASRASRLTCRTTPDRFLNSPARAGLAYAFDPRLKDALAEEIALQFSLFAGLGFAPVYWDGHTHLHLHPTVLALTLPVASQHGFRAVRLVREPGNAPLQIIFRLLSRAAVPKLDARGIGYVDRLYGLEATGQVTTHRFESFLAQLPDGWSEIYFHPGAEIEELDADLLTEAVALRDLRLASTREF
ncbi:MAG TPA: ChbG/HpnK family deacetylase [Chthoniobacteraceae bacterium]|nr:ChbG/HpnK family deacetylase [Chthoniobacteraceae bacterium]